MQYFILHFIGYLKLSIRRCLIHFTIKIKLYYYDNIFNL